MLASGKVEVVTGTSPHGQGHETAWAQIAADALGVDVEHVAVTLGDTAVGLHAPQRRQHGALDAAAGDEGAVADGVGDVLELAAAVDEQRARRGGGIVAGDDAAAEEEVEAARAIIGAAKRA